MATYFRGWFCLACLASLLATPPAALARSPQSRMTSPTRPSAVTTTDLARRLDANRMGLVVTNVGSIGFDIFAGGAGLWYPRDSSTTMLFASGLWIGAVVDSPARVTVAEYSQEYGPGRMIGGGPGDPDAPQNRVWKVRRWTGNPQDSAHVERTPGGPAVDPLVHHSWSEYMAGAVPDGAPWKLIRLPNTSTPDPSDSVDVPGPDVMGDLMTWCVFNDADPLRHTNDAGGSPPLGAEVQQTVFAFDDPGLMGDVAFVRWRITNRGAATWSACRAGWWSDPDIGGVSDDKVGCDTTRSLGFAYNGDAFDDSYGYNPPVLGFALLGSSPFGGPTRMDAFRAYVNGTDPLSPAESYFALSGLNRDGSPMVNPFANVTRFQYSGNPLYGSGWVDSSSADKRMTATFAPRTLVPGDTLELWAALIVAPGLGLTGALSQIQCRSDYVRTVFDAGLTRPFPRVVECDVPVDCPRPYDYWLTQAAGFGAYTPPAVDSLATFIDQRSATLDFGATPTAGLFSALSAGGDVRQAARREYAAFLANLVAGERSIQPIGETPVVLFPSNPTVCPDVPGQDVEALATTADSARGVSAAYVNLNADHRRALEGIDAGLSSFGGGAGAAYEFFGSSLNPATEPDSFPARVRIAFDQMQTQKAYRYLRMQQADGTAPAIGRFYKYAGFVPVPFTVRDSVTGEQLDACFVEIVVTDAEGTILPPALQPASFDSTWGPTDDPLGGREYLFISRRAHTGAPRADFATDGAVVAGDRPLLYVLWSRLRLPSDVIDDGDAFDFRFDYTYTDGVDALFRDLAGRPLTDPQVSLAYNQIADCLGSINRGEGIGPTCNHPASVQITLVQAEAEPGLARLAWRLAVPEPVTVERREGNAAWQAIASLTPDATGLVAMTDDQVSTGLRYSYRLLLTSGYAGEVTLVVPAEQQLSLAGFRPNPVRGPLAVALTLASSAPAKLEVIDVAGRRVFLRAIERPVPGERVVPLTGVRFAPGVYVLRLTQGSERLVVRGVVLR